ncbi:RNA chaperone Hfq [Cupriavidus lacunae]|uniref:RNA-binding protein Hfq n=1 Tax=Cupriavidus lacunae TaxID=2666307 RepID=A0A370NLH4_9BURK|nr:RNA chaperone Hfq [Cupriavidus lacunae]
MQPEQSSPQNDFLSRARKERKPVEVYLVNGVRLSGSIVSFDQFVVILSAPSGAQAIYKSAISTIQLQGQVRESSGSGTRTAQDKTPDNESATPRVVTRKRRPANGNGGE